MSKGVDLRSGGASLRSTGPGSRLYVSSKTAATGATADGASPKLPGIKLNASSLGTTGIGKTPRYERFALIWRSIGNTEATDALESRGPPASISDVPVSGEFGTPVSGGKA